MYCNRSEIISEESRSRQDIVVEELCEAIGSSKKSQHAKAEAVDFECIGVDNAEVADWVHMNCETDQLILEFYTPGEPNSGWIHASYIPYQPRRQFMHAYREEKRVKYKPIIGKGKRFSMSIIDKKSIKYFQKIDTVHGSM